MFQLYNPVTDSWHPRWRGHIDDVAHDLVPVAAPDMPLSDAQIICTGIFDYLGGCKMLPGVFGNFADQLSADTVFYENGRFDDRCIKLLDDALIDVDMRVTFTGNVYVNETQYDVDDVILQALRDACDAEFPGVANVYEDRFGRVAIHGRHARFDPEGTAAGGANWDFNRWYAATREDVTGDNAQIREFGYNRPRSRIINSYVAWPREDEAGVPIDRDIIATLLRTDPTSIGIYGYRGDDAPDLILQREYAASGDRTGTELCGLFGDFYIANYAAVRKAIQRVTLKALRADDPRAAATWDTMCRMDISDGMNLTVDEAGLADTPFFIDGVSVECRVLNPDHDMVTVTPNLTPASYYDTDVFDV
jgi:hypothetical protein